MHLGKIKFRNYRKGTRVGVNLKSWTLFHLETTHNDDVKSVHIPGRQVTLYLMDYVSDFTLVWKVHI